MMYDDELANIIIELKSALLDISEIYHCPISDCEFTFHPNDIISIDIRGVAKMYFYSLQEVIDWAYALDKGGHNGS